MENVDDRLSSRADEVLAVVRSGLADIAKVSLDPCKVLLVTKIMKDTVKVLGINQSEFIWIKQRYTFSVIKNEITVYFLFLFHKYFNLGYRDVAKELLRVITVNVYSILFKRYFPRVCYKVYFDYAVSLLSPRHLYKRGGSIYAFLISVSDSQYDRVHRLSELGIPDLLRLYVVLKHRVNQSLKSLAVKYYEAVKLGVRTYRDVHSRELEVSLSVNESLLLQFIRVFCIYHDFDYKIINDVSKLSLITGSLILRILRAIGEPLSDDVLEVIRQFLRSILDIRETLFSDDRVVKEVHRLMSIRRVPDDRHFKSLVIALTEKIYDRMNMLNTLRGYSNRYRFRIYYAVALIIMLSFANYYRRYVNQL